MRIRPVEELASPEHTAWTQIQGLVEAAPAPPVVAAALDGTLGASFATLRWPGRERETAALAPEQGISLYPPPFSVEGADPSAARRSAVPLQELFAFYREAAQQLGSGS